MHRGEELLSLFWYVRVCRSDHCPVINGPLSSGAASAVSLDNRRDSSAPLGSKVVGMDTALI